MREETLFPLLNSAMDAAFEGGRAIMQVYAAPFEVAYKSDRSPLTEADQGAHEVITAALSVTQLPVLSEEGAAISIEERTAWQHYWLVDPLDGTKEFVKRNDEFTVNIALMQRDGLPAGALGCSEPLAGVIYAPVPDILYFAWKGGGSYRLANAATHTGLSAYERVAMSTRMPEKQQRTAYTVLASRSHRSAESDALMQQLEREYGALAFAFKGSALKFGLMAEGAADIYPRYAPTMEWDTAAGQIICSEAGKQLIDVTTNAPMRYNKHELVNNWFIVQ
jgi:3'(2'), 5'-bisphosphate nucleotidase